MARTPVDVYQGLLKTQLEDTISNQIDSVTQRFADIQFLGTKVSVHLSRFLRLTTKLVSYLESRDSATPSDVTTAIDVLDFHLNIKMVVNDPQRPGISITTTITGAKKFHQINFRPSDWTEYTSTDFRSFREANAVLRRA